MLVIVVSGPKASITQARTAMAGAGLNVQSTDHDHGLAAFATEKEVREAQGFITIHGDDVNKAHEAGRSLGWRLRLHYPHPESLPPTPEELLAAKLASMQADIDALKAQLGNRK